MKIRVLSDLHLEFSEWEPPKVDCDVVVLAGDIHVGAKALPWIERHFQGQTVVYIQGNHEGYGHDISAVTQEINDYSTSEPPIVDLRYLNNEWTPVSKGTETVWFFGGTLWTDFELDGCPTKAKLIARQCMNDYRLIKLRGERLQPDDTVAMHKDFLTQFEHGAPVRGKTVVVGHHLPSPRSIDNEYRASEVNPAYASNLERLMYGPCAPALWIHGHTHRSKDYVCGNTRVVANPRGYSYSKVGAENQEFRGDLVVEV